MSEPMKLYFTKNTETLAEALDLVLDYSSPKLECYPHSDCDGFESMDEAIERHRFDCLDDGTLYDVVDQGDRYAVCLINGVYKRGAWTDGGSFFGLCLQ